MAERSVRVRLTAVIDDYKRNMGEAAKATGQVGEAASDAEKKSSRIGDAARTAGRVAVTGLGIAATATAALGTAALTTGLAYNSLEQTSRAALTTLLGSAQAATAQMGELREFVRTSPFPREVFIQAQQQMIAFGFAAEDVIPTLAAVQDAVAAAGGSATDIQEVVRVLSQVQSTGRVTAENLNQLGVRGIDAAQLIGNAFGKTAGQIRDDISSGAIDAETFLTTLTQQMEARFGGAAANVQQTWAGAVDSLRGAFRDVGSVIAAPFVDPMGGGAAVDWARGLAQALRALEGVLGPVVEDLAQRAGPAFAAVTDTLERATEALRGADIDNVTGQLERFAPAIAGLGAAGLTASSGLLPFVRTIGPQGALIAGVSAFVLSVPEARDVLGQLLEALAPLVPVLTELVTELLPLVTTLVEGLAEALGPVVSAISAVVDSTVYWIEELEKYGLVAKRAGDDTKWWERNIFEVSEMLVDLIRGTDGATEATGFFVGKFTQIKERGKEVLGALAEAEVGFTELADGTAVATEELQNYLDWVRRATDPIYALDGALRDVEKAQGDYNDAVEEYGRKSPEAEAAALNLMRQLDNLEAAALNGELSFDEFEQRLDSWVRQGKITRDEADVIRGRVEDLRKEAEDYQGEYNARITETGGDAVLQRLRDIGAVINGLPSRKDITIAALTGSHTPTFGITRSQGGPVDGPGSPTVDSIPAMLAPGEYVMKAAARAKYGDRFMQLVNEGMLPAGGLSRIHATHDSSGIDATDFINAAGRVAAQMGVAAGLSSGRVLPRGKYRIGRGSAAHGYGALDLPAPIGTPVYSVAPGVVSRAMRLATSYGIHAFVNHPGNRQSRYAHLSSLAVRAGQAVTGGQLLGRVGSTGNSTGPHLHYEDLKNGVRRAPERLGIFDQGGRLRPGMLGLNTSGGTESVLSPRQSVMFDRLVGSMERSGTVDGSPRDVRVTLDITGSGAQAESFKASMRKGEIQILVDGRRAQVA